MKNKKQTLMILFCFIMAEIVTVTSFGQSNDLTNSINNSLNSVKSKASTPKQSTGSNQNTIQNAFQNNNQNNGKYSISLRDFLNQQVAAENLNAQQRSSVQQKTNTDPLSGEMNNTMNSVQDALGSQSSGRSNTSSSTGKNKTSAGFGTAPAENSNTSTPVNDVLPPVGCYHYDRQFLIDHFTNVTEEMIGKLLPEIAGMKKMQAWYDKYDRINEEYEKWSEANRLYFKWKMGNYENLNDGVNFARQMAASMSSIRSFIPFPEGVSELMGCLFKMIPILVNSYTDILVKYIQKIDDNIANAEGGVTYNQARCTTIMIKPGDEKIIDALDISSYKKEEVFHKACEVGLAQAVRQIVFTKY